MTQEIDYADEMDNLIRVAGGVSSLLLAMGMRGDGEFPIVEHFNDGLYVLGCALQDAEYNLELAMLATKMG